MVFTDARFILPGYGYHPGTRLKARRKKYDRKRYIENREAIKKRNKAYDITHRENARERCRTWQRKRRTKQ